MEAISTKHYRIGGKLYSCEQPQVMGIVNLTPDSFFSGSRAQTQKEIEAQVDKHLSEGADMLDFGAYSTRPGAEAISAEEELNRLQIAFPLINKYKKHVPVSIDSFRSQVIQESFDEIGHFMVNDISGGHIDPEMYRTVSRLGLPYIGMHMRGTPQTMMENTEYISLVDDMVLYFAEMIEELKILGTADIIIDPGFGFSKTLGQNYQLMNELDKLSILDRPVLVGISRKSMIFKLLETDAIEALNGSTVLNTIAVMKGANILRVHDVKEAKEVVKLTNALDKV